MKILITGNLGYIGPLVIKRLRQSFPSSTLLGFDLGYFSHSLTSVSYPPEKYLDIQYFGDVRKFPYEILCDVDIVIYLAAISNDPMGQTFEKPTYEINQFSAINLAKACRKASVKRFIFASSCSVYGSADEKPRIEDSELQPLTAYARSKVETEKQLQLLAGENFIITCLRFATACGFSPRLRLDLVLNDFVASAIANGKIEILSDGSPWRPLIHIKDMARAIDWACTRKKEAGGEFLAINTGSNKWNYQINELAKAVKKTIGNVEILINQNALPDKRSYKVDFSKFKNLAGKYYPKVDLHEAVNDLYEGLSRMSFSDKNFRKAGYIRLITLNNHINHKRLNQNLEWL